MLNVIVVHEYGDPYYGNEDDIRKEVTAWGFDGEPVKGESIDINGFETAVCLAG